MIVAIVLFVFYIVSPISALPEPPMTNTTIPNPFLADEPINILDPSEVYDAIYGFRRLPKELRGFKLSDKMMANFRAILLNPQPPRPDLSPPIPQKIPESYSVIPMSSEKIPLEKNTTIVPTELQEFLQERARRLRSSLDRLENKGHISENGEGPVAMAIQEIQEDTLILTDFLRDRDKMGENASGPDLVNDTFFKILKAQVDISLARMAKLGISGVKANL